MEDFNDEALIKLIKEADDIIQELLDHDCRTCDLGYGMEHYNITGRASAFHKKLEKAELTNA